MSAEARGNGWRGFDGIGERVEGGWLYRCDGMPAPRGCLQEIVVPRRWTRVGTKKSGWMVAYGLEPKGPDILIGDPDGWLEDRDVVLTFCPDCAEVVKKQDLDLKMGRAS